MGAADDSRCPQGFILVRIVADEAEVLTFCVAEGVRRGGLGSALLEEACNIVQRRGGVQIFLEVSQDNLAALTLYRKCGFAEVGRRAAYYRQGSLAADALVMRKPIATVSTSVQADSASSFPAGPESTKRE
jgi:ribosomal-protein-alanine N-acetyltransferase